jgi:hypothetical protein
MHRRAAHPTATRSAGLPDGAARRWRPRAAALAALCALHAGCWDFSRLCALGACAPDGAAAVSDGHDLATAIADLAGPRDLSMPDLVPLDVLLANTGVEDAQAQAVASVQPLVPSNLQGDQLLAYVFVRAVGGSDPTVTPPSDWNLLCNSVTPGVVAAYLYEHTAAAGDVSPTFGLSPPAVAAFAWFDARNASAIFNASCGNAVGQGANGDQFTIAGRDTGSTSRLVVSLFLLDALGSDGLNWSAPPANTFNQIGVGGTVMLAARRLPSGGWIDSFIATTNQGTTQRALIASVAIAPP